MTRVDQVEDIYTLSPTQLGILYHVLADKESSPYFEQAVFTLEGPLDPNSFAVAWRQVINRHPALRTGFVWEEVRHPLQIVHRLAESQVQNEDWRGLSVEEQEARLAKWIENDRRRGFDLAKPPLMRLALFKVEKDRSRAVWSSHHLALDAWSNIILLEDLFECYEAIRRGAMWEPAQAPGYREYIAWLKRQDQLESEAFWRRRLEGFITPTRLTTEAPRGPSQDRPKISSQRMIHLSNEITQAINGYAQRHRLTINLLLAGAWAALLSHYSGESDVVFGSVTSGRPTTLVNAEATVGLFINTLPTRVKVDAERPLLDWLLELRGQSLRMREHEHVSLARIQSLSDLPKGAPLFETVLVFLNMGDLSRQPAASLEIRDFKTISRSSFPLTIRATPGAQLQIEAIYDSGRFTDATITNMLGDLEILLTAMARRGESKLEELIAEMGRSNRSQQTAAGSERRRLSAKMLLKAKPQAVRLSSLSLIEADFLNASRLPMVLQPRAPELDLITWVAANLDFIETRLIQHGGLLFRGFRIDSIAEFERFMKTLCPDLLEYRERSTPRTHLGGKIYTSTEYPAHQHIALHNEFSYALAWPMKIAFFCVRAADRGGETPIADSRRVFQNIDPRLRGLFIEKQVMYVRNYGKGIDLTWQEAFQTNDRAEVEEHCRRAPMDWEWRGEDQLRTRQVRRAVTRHPQTGDNLWFNQAHLFHVSNLEPALRESMLSAFGEQDLPRNAFYGDGAPFSDSELDDVRAAYQESSVVFPWQEGDLLLLDNMLIAHGRNPFVGHRKIVVAMAQRFSYD
jgi:alpha-ketoglutarate-dependent taurine dioxygenase